MFDETPASIIRFTISNFKIPTDRDAIDRINDSLLSLQQSRDLRLRDAQSSLKKLCRSFASQQSHYNENAAAQSASDHAARIMALDTQKFRLAKAVSDLEIETERLEQELDALNMRLLELEMQGLDGGETERGKRELEDVTILQLKIYRSLGIEVETDGAGRYSKAVVRNNRKGDVHVINVDPKVSRYIYTKFLWDAI